MTAYSLIHGSGQGPDGWKLLAHDLERRGYSVLTPAFEVSRTDQGLAWHADTIVQALDRSGWKPSDVVCVAHSASGIYTFPSLRTAGLRIAWCFWPLWFHVQARAS
jgi:hypothetical protein